MNPLITLFKSISNQELQRALKEIRESDKTGTLPENSIIRKYCRLGGEISGVMDIHFTQTYLLKEASMRWLSEQEELSKAEDLSNITSKLSIEESYNFQDYLVKTGLILSDLTRAELYKTYSKKIRKGDSFKVQGLSKNDEKIGFFKNGDILRCTEVKYYPTCSTEIYVGEKWISEDKCTKI